MVDYPSDAPLPQFNITKVSGKSEIYDGVPTAVSVFVKCDLSNYQQFVDWWLVRGYVVNNDYLVLMSPPSDYPRMDFKNGVSVEGMTALFYGMDFEKWNAVSFTAAYNIKSLGGGEVQEMVFNKPLYLCDVYIPSASTLPSDVFTDLQFTVSPPPPIPEVPWTVILPLAIFGIGALAYWYLKKRK